MVVVVPVAKGRSAGRLGVADRDVNEGKTYPMRTISCLVQRGIHVLRRGNTRNTPFPTLRKRLRARNGPGTKGQASNHDFFEVTSNSSSVPPHAGTSTSAIISYRAMKAV